MKSNYLVTSALPGRTDARKMARLRAYLATPCLPALLLLVAGAAMAQTPPSGWVNVVSLSSGKCLDMTGGPGATSPGVLAQQWTCLGTSQTNQIFELISVSGGYEIQVMNSGLAIGPVDGATASGTHIEQSSYSSSNTYQEWIVKPASTSGYYTLSPASESTSCMDVSADSASNGALIQEWSCSGAENQEWEFVPLNIASPPTISSVSPSSGPTEGGTDVTIKGSNFASDATVTFGGTAATNVLVVSSTEITAMTPAGNAGNVPVAVTNPGTTGVNLANGFTYATERAATSGSSITYVQGNDATPQSPQTTVAVPFTAAQNAGDFNVVVVGWNDSTATVQTVTDSSGNNYARAVGPTVQTGTASLSIYYATNIAAASAGTNTVTVTFNSAANYADIRVLEYAGVDQSNPVDVTAASSGNSGTASSGSATTPNGTDLIFGANVVQTLTSGPGSGFTERLLTSPDGNIAEDRLATSVGSYSASAPLSSSGPWIMQMVAFRASSGGTPPPPPSSHSVSLTWNASTSSDVVSYNVYRATGTSSTYSKIATGVADPLYTDTNVTDGTSYTYVVTAVDNEGDESAYSNAAEATVPST